MLTRFRSFVLLILGLVLVGSLAAAVPASAEDADPSASPVVAAPLDSDGDGTLDAPDTAAAAAGAASEGEPVEDLSQRTGTVTVVANPDATLTSKEFATPVRIERGGDWVNVDYTLAKRSDGSWSPKAAPVDVTINGGSTKEAARVTFDDGQSLAVTWPQDLPDPTVNGGVATYKLSQATDLLVSTTSSGVNARIRLNQQPADDDPVLTLGLRAEGVNLDQTNTGGLEISDTDGKTIAQTSALVAWDAASDPAGDPANVVDLGATLDTATTSGDVTQHTLDLTTPAGFLTDPDTQYPVTIDPDISMTKVRDTWVRNGDTASHASEQRLIVGKIDPSTTTNPGPTRSYLKFYNSTIEDNPNIEVISAELGLWQYYGYSCTDRRMYAYPVSEPWNDTITWANKPPVAAGFSTYVDNNRAASGCASGWTTMNVTNMAEAWNTGTVDMQGIRLHAADEDYSSYERRFCSMNPQSGTECNTATRTPYLSVTFKDVSSWFRNGATFEDGSTITYDSESGDTTLAAPAGVPVDLSEAAEANADGLLTLGTPDVPAEVGAPSETDFNLDPEDDGAEDAFDEEVDLPNVDGDVGESVVGAPSIESENPFSTLANVPKGYKLYGNNRVDAYHYKSRGWYLWHMRREGGKWVKKAEVKMAYHQTLNGGKSRLWNIETSVRWIRGYNFDYNYKAWCGIVRKNARDTTCKTGDSSASPVDDDDLVGNDVWNMSVGTDRWYDIGKKHSGYAKYPLIRIKITWNTPGGGKSSIEAKARGWDARHKDGWKLAGATNGDQAEFSVSPG